MRLQQYYQSFVDRLQTSASVKTVFGEPIETMGRTIIPVARAAYGFGGGPVREGENNSVEFAAGGGGGVSTMPVGFIEVTDESTRFVPVGGSWEKCVVGLVVGFGVGYLVSRYGNRK